MNLNIDQLIRSLYNRFHNSTVMKTYPDVVNSYSQYLEDVIIDGILCGKQNGFYVDIGANHPTLFNNTKRFYDRGWTGINIEPNPLLHKLLEDNRTRDINLCVGAGDKSEKLAFYTLSSDTISTFDKSFAKNNSRRYNSKITNIEKIKVVPLKDILSQYDVTAIDFMSIDVEGFEMSVLRGNDWNKYHPNIIIIETSPPKKEVMSFLENCGYRLIFYNGCNSILVTK
jgi:FkbM family methyltransferase